MTRKKIDKDSLNWQAGYYQGPIDRMTDFMEAPEEMLARAKWLSDLRKQLDAERAEGALRDLSK